MTRPDGVVVPAPAPGAALPGTAPRLDPDRLRGGRPAHPQRMEGLAGWAVTGDGETISYDPEGYPVERADAAGGRWRAEYGPFGLLRATVDADGLRTSYTYDTELRITSVTDPRGLVWRYAYDPAGRLVSETDFNGRTRYFGYDAAGRPITATNGLGETVEFVRDPLGNVIERRTPTGTTTYRYDRDGRLVEAGGAGTRLAVEWDADGRRVAETVDGRTVRLDRDAATGTVTRHTPAGVVSAWTMDPFGRPYALRSGGHELRLRHDVRGRETHRAVDGRAVMSQTHGDGDRLLAQELPGTGVRGFEHRADGMVTAITDWTGRREYDLDRTGRVTGVRGAGHDETYHYRQGRLDGEYDGTLLRAAGPVSGTYDAHGRMTSRTVAGAGTWHFTWNADDQLVEAHTPGGDVWRYRYDPLGRRISKQRVTGGVAVERYDFAWSGSTLVEQAHTDADGTLRVTTWDHHPGDGRPVARTVRVGADLDYATVVTDAAGTPTELLGADGALRWRNSATLWGATDTPAAVQPLAFPGQYRDDETGLHYNVFRYYDPLAGRYLSQDPLGLAPALDPAGYVANPLLLTDPLGLMCTGPGGSSVPHVTPGGTEDLAATLDLFDEAGDLGVSAITAYKNPYLVIPNLVPNVSKPKWLYHGSDVPPEKIFQEGLKSNAIFKEANPHYDIKLHQQNSSKVREGNTYSGFISTTSDWSTALQFVRDKDIAFQLQNLPAEGVEFTRKIGGKEYKMHYGYVYVVRADSQPFVELNVQAVHDASKASQMEFAALDHIPGKNISHAFKIDMPYNVGIKDGVQQLDIPPGQFKMEQFDNDGYVPGNR
ncbi:RHS repeat-associated protein [Actinoplanes teichomyceticus]|uniref:RHS repeat-associated protein n=1 Tax=Actinoplanes teichomyceticus TaxID=1867 RepID=A0A561WK81_ACTTI|nr:RHS repeat-associated protein [Actinoplanes teichomyceticus]